MNTEPDQSAAADEAQSKEDSRKVARRYFIRAAIYAAPAVASVVAVQHASAFSCAVCGGGATCGASPQCVTCNGCN